MNFVTKILKCKKKIPAIVKIELDNIATDGNIRSAFQLCKATSGYQDCSKFQGVFDAYDLQVFNRVTADSPQGSGNHLSVRVNGPQLN